MKRMGGPGARRHFLSNDEKAEVLRLWKLHYNGYDIARHSGCSVSLVYLIAAQAGEPKRGRGFLSKHLSV